MADQIIAFEKNGVNMLALPGPGAKQIVWNIFDTGVIDKTWGIDEGLIGIDVPGVDAGVDLFFKAFAKLYATLSYDAGSVDIDYAISTPGITSSQTTAQGLPFFQNKDAVWSTSAAYSSADFDTVAANLANNFFRIDLDYELTAGFKNGRAKIDLGFTDFGVDQTDFGFSDPQSFGPGPGTQNVFKLDQTGMSVFGTQLLNAPQFDLAETGVSGIEGFLKIPTPVPDQPKDGDGIGWGAMATRSTAGLPTIVMEGDAANFFQMEFHIVDWLVSAFPVLAPLSYTLGDGDTYLKWELIDIYPDIGVQLSQEISFTPTAVAVHLDVRNQAGVLIQQIDGLLGDNFAIETPDFSTGTLTITPTYTLYGDYRSTVGFKVNGGLTFQAFDFESKNTRGPGFVEWYWNPPPMVDEELLSFQSDRIDLYTSDPLALMMTKTAAPIQIAYQNDLVGNYLPQLIDLRTTVVVLSDGTKTGQTSVDGAGGNDTIYANELGNTILGSDGSDSIYGEQRRDVIHGGSGGDLITGGDGDDDISGGFGNDFLYGNAGDDDLSTRNQDGTLGNGADFLSGGPGNDRLFSPDSNGADTLSGDEGVDAVFVVRNAIVAPMNVDIALAGTATGVTLPDGSVMREVERFGLFFAGLGNDTIKGGAFDDQISGNAGNDRIEASGGKNAVSGDGGDDTIVYQQDSAFVVGKEDFLDGGEGIDTLIYRAAADRPGERIDLSTGATQTGVDGSTFVSFEKISFDGWGGADTIRGGRYGDTILSGDGDDSIDGFLGLDSLDAGDGNDTIVATSGDTIDGGAGEDVLRINAILNETYTVSFSSGAALQKLSNGVIAKNVERLHFSGSTLFVANDDVTGGAAADTLNGGAGADILDGGGGSDSVDGGAGDDAVLKSGVADSILKGGAGDDRLTIDRRGVLIADAFTFDSSGALAFLPDGTAIEGFERLTYYGGALGDTIVGGDFIPGIGGGRGLGGSTARGFTYADILYGGLGKDDLKGGAGKDYVNGEEGDDVVHHSLGADVLDGGEGIDTLVVDLKQFPEADVNAILYAIANAAPDEVTVLADGTKIARFEKLKVIGDTGSGGGAGGGRLAYRASERGDDVSGTDGDDIVLGGRGADTIDGGRGFNFIDAGDGDDIIVTRGGNPTDPPDRFDIALGGRGKDFVFNAGLGRFYAEGGDGDDAVIGGDVDIRGGGVVQYLFGDGGDDYVRGGRGDDVVVGSNYQDTGDDARFDVAIGGAGNDYVLQGLWGRSYLAGEDGDDVVVGGKGSDSITFGRGNDYGFGGGGADFFFVDEVEDGGRDTLLDFGADDVWMLGGAHRGKVSFGIFDGGAAAYIQVGAFSEDKLHVVLFAGASPQDLEAKLFFVDL